MVIRLSSTTPGGEWTGLIDGYYLKRWEKFYAMLQDHLDAGTSYNEEGLPQTHGREAFPC
ncbi:MAG: alpha-N-acetylglucosaminidase C-terminal domain-containing protein [Parabacteroides merdae]